jgi:hypothetical protein
MMTEILYVSMDAAGVEHAASGDITWALPRNVSQPTTTENPHGLVLRTTSALLDVLDEAIYRAEPVGGASPIVDGTMAVASARLTSRAPWDTESATRFALACASHVLGDRSELKLPDGMTLGRIVADAQHMLDDLGPQSVEHLSRMARLSELWRLHRERGELGELAIDLTLDDEAKDLDTFDDPVYETVAPVIDAVLAAIGALRHHALPRSEEALDDVREEHEESAALEARHVRKSPTVNVTPFGSAMAGGGPHVTSDEPSWTGAREAARHARLAVRDERGAVGETEEREWQAAELSSLLVPDR